MCPWAELQVIQGFVLLLKGIIDVEEPLIPDAPVLVGDQLWKCLALKDAAGESNNV